MSMEVPMDSFGDVFMHISMVTLMDMFADACVDW